MDGCGFIHKHALVHLISSNNFQVFLVLIFTLPSKVTRHCNQLTRDQILLTQLHLGLNRKREVASFYGTKGSISLLMNK